MDLGDSDAIFEIAAALGIAIPDEYRASVLANFERLMEQAALVTAATLPSDADNGSEFTP